MYSEVEIMQNYSATDLVYVILTLLITLPISYIIQHILSSLRGYILGAVVLTGSLAGSVYMTTEYCHKDAGLWSMGCAIMAACEIGLVQNLCALVAAVKTKITASNNVKITVLY
jgi:hypothetical protein